MLRSRYIAILGAVSLSLPGVLVSSTCFGQVATKKEVVIPIELQNRTDVQQILAKLRFLRMNESLLGENHPSKQITQTQIQEHEFDLTNIIEVYGPRKTFTGVEGSENVEDALPQSLSGRPEVQLIIRKLRFLRMNDKHLGENHPSKKSTGEQIRGHEWALSKISQQELLPPPSPDSTDESKQTDTRVSQETENPREHRMIVQKLAILKTNQANYGENHPTWKIIQNEIQKHEMVLRQATPKR